MRIRLLSIGNKPPAWLKAGFEEYAKRMPASCQLELIEIPAERNTAKADAKLLASIHPDHHVVALDIKGKSWSTEELSTQLSSWLQQGRNMDLLIGGADGLSKACLEKASQKWSLSPLTFPHLLVRVIVAEQLYRAHSILQKHPYHRP